MLYQYAKLVIENFESKMKKKKLIEIKYPEPGKKSSRKLKTYFFPKIQYKK